MTHGEPPPDPAQRVIALDVGTRFSGQCESLGGFDGRWRDRPAVKQAMQQIEDMRFGRHAGLQRHIDGREHDLLVVLENEGEDLDHLAVSARHFEQVLLQGLEGVRHLGEGAPLRRAQGLRWTTAR